MKKSSDRLQCALGLALQSLNDWLPMMMGISVSRSALRLRVRIVVQEVDMLSCKDTAMLRASGKISADRVYHHMYSKLRFGEVQMFYCYQYHQKMYQEIYQNKNVAHPRNLTLRAADCSCIPIPPFHGLKFSARLLG
jgi:hypothetical protein